MALEKTTERQIEILADGTIQVRDAEIVLEDGVEIGRRYHRRVFNPGASLANESCERTKAVAGAVWTQAVIDDFKGKQQIEK